MEWDGWMGRAWVRGLKRLLVLLVDSEGGGRMTMAMVVGVMIEEWVWAWGQVGGGLE